MTVGQPDRPTGDVTGGWGSGATSPDATRGAAGPEPVTLVPGLPSPRHGGAPGGYPTGQHPAGSGGYPPAGYPQPLPPAPVSGPRRRPFLAILVAILAVAVIAQAVFLVQLSGRLDRANRQASAQQSAQAARLDGLDARTKALAGSSLDSAAVAAAVLPSVFRIDAGDFSGTAFVIASRDGTSTLLTNYHVVAALFTGGGREVALQHDSQRFTARISKVDKDNDLALLETSGKFPALAVATQQVSTGAPVIVVGAPLGLAQSVTTGVVSAVRSDFPGEAGKTYIQFSAPINPGNSGGPVVDGQKKVVGIASAKATDAEGIGLAIPISVACDSFAIC